MRVMKCGQTGRKLRGCRIPRAPEFFQVCSRSPSVSLDVGHRNPRGVSLIYSRSDTEGWSSFARLLEGVRPGSRPIVLPLLAKAFKHRRRRWQEPARRGGSRTLDGMSLKSYHQEYASRTHQRLRRFAWCDHRVKNFKKCITCRCWPD